MGFSPMYVSTLLVSVYARIVSMPSSRPYPDCLYPPNGTPGKTAYGVLIATVPVRSARATRLARPMFCDHTLAERP